MATATESAWTSEPFRLGPPEQFSRARELLMRAGFEETPLCARASVNSIYEFPRPDGRSAFKDITDAQSLFVRLFIDGDQVARSVVESILSPDDLEVLEALGLIHPVRDNAELRTAAVAIYPVEELYIASDRRHGFESTHEVPPSDLVFSPMTRETQRFLRLMPRESSKRVTRRTTNPATRSSSPATISAQLSGEGGPSTFAFPVRGSCPVRAA